MNTALEFQGIITSNRALAPFNDTMSSEIH